MKSLPWILGGTAILWDMITYCIAKNPFVHTQTYAAVIVVLMFPIVQMVIKQLRAGTELLAPREETIALAGVALVSVATLVCCLLAPSTVEVPGVPGKTVAIAEHNASLQFPLKAVSIADRNAMQVDVHLGSGHMASVGARFPILLGDMLISLHARTVATISARGVGGDSLTITQPAGAVFLSPMLKFPKMTSIAELQLPSDVFAIPARDRTVRAFLVTKDLMRDARVARMSGGSAGVLFSVDDIVGKPLAHGIGFASDGLPVQIADVVLRAKLGYFPDVSVASVPQPLPILIGLAAYIFGGATLAYRRRFAVTS